MINDSLPMTAFFVSSSTPDVIDLNAPKSRETGPLTSNAIEFPSSFYLKL
jgi:hypothetical protein